MMQISKNRLYLRLIYYVQQCTEGVSAESSVSKESTQAAHHPSAPDLVLQSNNSLQCIMRPVVTFFFSSSDSYSWVLFTPGQAPATN